MRSQATLAVRALRLVDVFVFACALTATLGRSGPLSGAEIGLLALIVPLHAILLEFFQLYESHRLEGAGLLVRQALSAQFVGFLATAGGFWVVGRSDRWESVALFSAVATGALLISRLGLYGGLRLMRKRGYDIRNVCVVGSWEAGLEATERFEEHPEWGLRVVLVGDGAPESRQFYTFPQRELAGDSLEDVLKEEIVDEILIRVRAEDLPRETQTIQFCEQYGVLGRVLVDSPSETARLEQVGDRGLALAVGERRSETQVLLKRLVDIMGSVAAIAVLWPLLAVIALLVRLSSPGPALFRQRRVGLNGRQFRIYKFRTMVNGAEGMLPTLAHRSISKGPAFKDPSDWRVTPLGRVLRRFSLDELPQIFNVLKGDMSLVGPRPLPVHEAREISGGYRKRFSVRPGITCLWQVSGRSDIDFARWMKLDLEYIDHWSLWLDFKLILLTVPAVLSGRGAY